MDASQLVQQFVQFYYGNFASREGRKNLGGIYIADSTISFNGNLVRGAEQITEYLTERLTFQTVDIQQPNVSCVPAGPKLLVNVCGYLRMDGAEQLLPFTQVFLLVPYESGAYVEAEIFNVVM